MKSTKTTSKTLTREQIDERINIKNITKDELAEKIAEKTGVAKKTVKTVLTDTLDSIIEISAEGNRIELRGFGNFKVNYKEPRIARNPATNAPINLGEKYVPYFKISPAFKEQVDEQLKKLMKKK